MKEYRKPAEHIELLIDKEVVRRAKDRGMTPEAAEAKIMKDMEKTEARMADANESTFYKSCPSCDGNHYVKKVLPSNVLQLDGDDYVNCPI